MLEPARAASRQVLLAEDHPVNQLVATAMLGNLGFETDVVDSGADAVKAAIDTPYRVIFMDCQIPVLDGYQATAEIRRLECGLRRTPVIAVTSSDMQSDRDRCLAAGMDDFLTKPLTLNALSGALTRWAPDAREGGAPPDPMPARVAHPFAAQPASAPRRAALDPKIVARLERLGAATGEDLMSHLTVLFLADADVRMAAMHTALERDNLAAIVRSAHTLSGASANLGATDLAGLFATLAAYGAAGDLIHGVDLLDAAGAELERVRAALLMAATT